MAGLRVRAEGRQRNLDGEGRPCRIARGIAGRDRFGVAALDSGQQQPLSRRRRVARLAGGPIVTPRTLGLDRVRGDRRHDLAGTGVGVTATGLAGHAAGIRLPPREIHGGVIAVRHVARTAGAALDVRTCAHAGAGDDGCRQYRLAALLRGGTAADVERAVAMGPCPSASLGAGGCFALRSGLDRHRQGEGRVEHRAHGIPPQGDHRWWSSLVVFSPLSRRCRYDLVSPFRRARQAG